jgi:hypothetical protein
MLADSAVQERLKVVVVISVADRQRAAGENPTGS